MQTSTFRSNMQTVRSTEKISRLHESIFSMATKSEIGIRLIFQIMAEPDELFTKAQKSEIILQYSKLGSATSMQRF